MTYPSSPGFLLIAAVAASSCGGPSKSETAPDKHEPLLLQGDESDSRRSQVPDIGDDDGDDMQIEGLKGHLDPYDIQAGIEPHSSKLASCFQGQAKKHKFLGGEVELGFTVARDGSVKTVQVVKSSIGSWAVEKCLLEKSSQMGFKEPKGGEANFSLPLDFQATRVANWWSEDQASEELGKRPGELKACRSESGAQDPHNVWVTLYLGNRGVIQSVGFASPHKEGIAAEWAECAAQKVSAWTLTDPRGKIAKLGFRYNPE
jgi:TonB family protein